MYVHIYYICIYVYIGSLGEPSEATLWWSYIGALFTLLVIDIAWRLRFIHGGADAKALMWVTLLFPSWAEVPVLSTDSMNEIVLHLPPSLSLLIWGGFGVAQIYFHSYNRNFPISFSLSDMMGGFLITLVCIFFLYFFLRIQILI